jgi:hypothetical protein
MLELTILLTLICASIDYKSLPYLVAKYITPDGENLALIMKFGKASIALLVGVYTWLALTFDANGMSGAARGLVIWLLLEVSLSLWVLYKRARKVKQG